MIQTALGSNVYFKQKLNTPAVYPAQNGWITSYDNSYLITDPLEFQDSHQVSIEFEVFPAHPSFMFDVLLLEDWWNPNPMKISFSNWYTRIDNPYMFTEDFKVKAQKWTRIVITLCRLETPNQTRVSIYTEVMTAYGSTPASIDNFEYDFLTSQYGLRGSTLQIGILDNIGLVKSMKYYRYAINRKTIRELSLPIQESGNVNYYFQEEFYNNYYKYYADPGVAVPAVLNS